MNIREMHQALIVFLLFSGPPSAAIASEVRYSFAAEISSIFVHDALSDKNTFVEMAETPRSRFENGQRLSGALSYTPETPKPTYKSEVDGAEVYSISYSLSFEMQNGFVYTNNPHGTLNTILISIPPDSLFQWSNLNFSSVAATDPLDFQIADLTFFDKSGTAITEYKIPSYIDINNFHYKSVGYSWLDKKTGNQVHFQADITQWVSTTRNPH